MMGDVGGLSVDPLEACGGLKGIPVGGEAANQQGEGERAVATAQFRRRSASLQANPRCEPLREVQDLKYERMITPSVQAGRCSNAHRANRDRASFARSFRPAWRSLRCW